MTKPVNVQELDLLQFRMRCAAGIVGAIQVAMDEGSAAAEGYSEALYGAYDYLNSLVVEMHNLYETEEKA